MSDTSLPQGNTDYQADVSVLATGTELIGRPCTIWTITVICETAGIAVVSFSNSKTSYSSTTRNLRVVNPGGNTVHLSFPKGLYCSTGLCVIANKASVDISISYD